MGEQVFQSQLDRIYEEESARLEEQWRNTHYSTMLVLSLITVGAEVLFSFVLRSSGIISTTPARYYLRYVFIPACTYTILDLLVFFFYRCQEMSGKLRNYLVSFAFAVLCLAVSFFHDYFVVVYASGTAAIAMTTLYGDRKLTSFVTLFLLIADVLVSFLRAWDPLVVRSEVFYINIALIVILNLCTYLISMMILQWEDKRRRAVVLRQLEIEQLREAAVRDELTGVRNRLGLRRHIAETTVPIRFVMTDIDHFKLVNDLWGHAAGDSVLQQLGRILVAHENEKLASFRYGGDEFLLTFTDTSEEEACAACGAIAAEFLDSLQEPMREKRIGLSWGVSPCREGMKPSEGIRLADEKLYEAKAAKLNAEKEEENKNGV
jgi:diguanylate cyclase (GGDEF)-like protein